MSSCSDGDRLRVGDYDILVSLDNRIDFLPATGEEHSAAKHLDSGIGHSLDFDNLLTPRETEASGSLPVGNAFGVRLNAEARANLLETLQRSVERPARVRSTRRRTGRIDSVVPGMAPTDHGAPAPVPSPLGRPQRQPLATRTGHCARARFTREELADALARRKTRVDARERCGPVSPAGQHVDGPAVGGAGLLPRRRHRPDRALARSPGHAATRRRPVAARGGRRAQRHHAARATGAVGAAVAALPVAPGSSSNPLRSSTSIEQALQRLFESHGRLFAGPVDSLRDVLQDMRDHETALAAGMKAGLDSVLGQLSPANVADQFEQGRARQLAPGQDPRPRYWEHYSEFYRLLTQQTTGNEELPRSFTEAFELEYARMRGDLRQKRPT